MTPADPFLLFVYGTLKSGGVRHRLLAGQRLLGEVVTGPGYALYHLGDYPGMLREAVGPGVVAGELYEVALEALPGLDEAEGAPDWFRLEPVELADGLGPALAYFYRQDPAGRPLCPGGVWHNPASPAR